MTTDELIIVSEREAKSSNKYALMRSQAHALLAIAQELKRANDLNEFGKQVTLDGQI